MTDLHHDAVRRDNLERARANADHPVTPPKKHPFQGRWTRRQWAHASVVTTMGVLLVAIVPGFSNLLDSTMSAKAQRMTLSLTLPKASALAGKSTDDNWQSV